MEILWTEVRVREKECPFLRVAWGSFKEVEIKGWCGRVFRLWQIQMIHSWFMKTQMNCPCQPCKHNPAHSMNSYSRFHPQTFIQQDEINSSRFIMLEIVMLDFHYTRIIFQIHSVLLNFVHQRILFEKKDYACHKNIKQHNCFHIHNNKIIFIKQQISKSEWFLKDHVTLKQLE